MAAGRVRASRSGRSARARVSAVDDRRRRDRGRSRPGPAADRRRALQRRRAPAGRARAGGVSRGRRSHRRRAGAGGGLRRHPQGRPRPGLPARRRAAVRLGAQAHDDRAPGAALPRRGPARPGAGLGPTRTPEPAAALPRGDEGRDRRPARRSPRRSGSRAAPSRSTTRWRARIMAAHDELAAGGMRVLGVGVRRLEQPPGRGRAGRRIERERDPGRPGRDDGSAAPRGARRGAAVQGRGHPAGDDHRRPPAHGAPHRARRSASPRTTRFVTGAELGRTLRRPSCARLAGEVSVFARVSPEHKIRLVAGLPGRRATSWP